MKIRNGFVSNSSSSSFVILGVKRNFDDESDYEKMEDERFDNGIRTLYVEEDDCDVITGFILADGDDYLDYISKSINELSEMAKKVSDTLSVDISEVQLITGTRPC